MHIDTDLASLTYNVETEKFGKKQPQQSMEHQNISNYEV